MKTTLFKVLLILIACISTASTQFSSGTMIDLACVRKHNASNTCHYNFTIDGVNYCYIDTGCKEKRDKILKKVQAGKLGLAKDWKLVCSNK